jgi:flagellar basal-body rod protein FlgC
MEVSRLFMGMNSSASGLAAQRTRMNTIAENLANVETTRTAEGGSYRRQDTVLTHDKSFHGQLDEVVAVRHDLALGAEGHMSGFVTESENYRFGGVKAATTPDSSPFREVYDPSHPDADENGIVKLPNVDLVQEMTDLISTSRNFEANATAFNASKSLMKKALEL